MVEAAPPNRAQEIREQVAIGTDGYLFHRFDQAFEQLCGRSLLTPAQIEAWTGFIERRARWCRAAGIGYYLLIAPEKHVVYEDKLPPGEKIAFRRPVRQLIEALPPALRASLIYPEAELKQARKESETYYRTDVHWTDFGAYVGYAALLKAMQATLPLPAIPLAALERRKIRMVGDLGVRLDPEPVEEGVRLVPPHAQAVRKVYGNQAFGRGQVEVFESENADGPRAVLFRDSNATAMLPFLSPHFSRLVAVSAEEFFDDLVNAERPSVVITEMTERYLANLHNSASAGVVTLPNELRSDGFVAATGLVLPLPTGRRDFALDFRTGGNAKRFMGTGWSEPEESHTWGLGGESTLTLEAPPATGDYLLELDVMGCTPPPHTAAQELRVLANERELGLFQVGLPVTVSCRLPKAVFEGEPALRLRLLHPDFISPKAAGFSADSRELAVAVSALRLRPAAEEEPQDGR